MIGFRVSREEENILCRDYIRIIPLFPSRISLPRRRTPNMQNQNPCIATKIQNAFMHGNSFLRCASVSSSVPSLWRSSQMLRCCHLKSHTPVYYSSFHFLFHYPSITPIYYSSFHFLFHYPIITPIYCSSFHFIFHYPSILGTRRLLQFSFQLLAGRLRESKKL